ncbi:3'-5' exoribonuclease YhaM family protein [Aerococcus kribbianus]|uniref:HD domain-containing protein n=1 Tax=Aerococcus kribbianus TaxID=2999064 RepID=A0A9X3FNG8_9LACT|nr:MULTISPECIES: HD domain-containing protein [unclassified Aerococcus]MCZ0717793.1 HD domain-containing protein [Aerococcus sp. YH-aer221]MCZ0726080.1 HD domain-containing protein [Aerococcus sp. YH-aer222]
MDYNRIYDIPVDENFETYLLIKLAEKRQDRNGKMFIAFTFEDRSGSISGMYWGASEEDLETFQAGRVVHIAGRRELYNGKPQVRINALRLARDDEPNDPEMYIDQGPMSRQEMIDEINPYLDAITNEDYQQIVRHILNQASKDFFAYPAAKKNHHAFVGGLGFHTISMLRLAQSVAYQYPIIDKSLLYAGVLLHDIGKTIELSDPLTTEYTLAGNMLGHITIISEWINQAVLDLGLDNNAEEIILLKHMVLSHHGKREWGSPVEPHLLEAEVLHHIDNLDASIEMIKEALDHTDAGQYTERIFGMDNRNFYKFKESH